jgi:hypothetical protein
MAKRVKKWFMLQVWRLQQVAQVLTLALLALNLALQVFGLIKWREDSLLSISYVGVPMILLLLAAVIWTFAIVWDVRLKMWREQTSVLIEKNPYMKERMSPKEIAIHAMTWIPVMDHLGKSDPAMKAYADSLRDWLKREAYEDKLTPKELEDILRHMGSEKNDLFGLKDK